MNTQWQINLLDDTEIDAMMEQGFSSEALAAFRGFPLGVMRADMWRYAALLKNGGLYSDVDCICMSSINEWKVLPSGGIGRQQGPWLLIALENDVHFCNWTFAATPGHPVLECVIGLIVDRFHKGIDYKDEHFVHNHTGPAVWTDAIRQVLNCKESPKQIWEDKEARLEAQRHGIIILDSGAFKGRFCRNEYGSKKFGDGWISWTRQRAELLHPK